MMERITLIGEGNSPDVDPDRDRWAMCVSLVGVRLSLCMHACVCVLF